MSFSCWPCSNRLPQQIRSNTLALFGGRTEQHPPHNIQMSIVIKLCGKNSTSHKEKALLFQMSGWNHKRDPRCGCWRVTFCLGFYLELSAQSKQSWETSNNEASFSASHPLFLSSGLRKRQARVTGAVWQPWIRSDICDTRIKMLPVAEALAVTQRNHGDGKTSKGSLSVSF